MKGYHIIKGKNMVSLQGGMGWNDQVSTKQFEFCLWHEIGEKYYEVFILNKQMYVEAFFGEKNLN